MRRKLLAAAVAVSVAACGVSQQQEIQLGQQAATEVAQQLPVVQDPEINRYINVLGDSIANVTSRADLEWHFFVVNSAEVNAFSLPGGFVYVNRGLIDRADKMDELAGVLGHEIGHVVERHSIQQMQNMQTANVGVALACVLTRVCQSQIAAAGINLAGNAVFASFSRQDETEADDDAFKEVIKAGISPEGLVTMFQKLLEERQTKPSGVEAWFATHPLEEDRIADIQRQINTLDPQTLASLTTDSPNFHTFKNRVAALPPPPPPPAAAPGQ